MRVEDRGGRGCGRAALQQLLESCLAPPPQGFGTPSGWAVRRCCGAGTSPGTWTARIPPAACRPACAGSARRCTGARGGAGERCTGQGSRGGLGQRKAGTPGRMEQVPAEKGWEAGFSPPPRPSHSAPEVRVLLFNSTGDRDPAALLKLLQVRDWLMGGQQAAQP